MAQCEAPDLSDAVLKPGDHVGNYRVVRAIGHGGMGIVFEALHGEIGRRVAIKVLHADISSNPEIARRFLNEARLVTQVSHPGLVQVFDFGRLPGGAAYIVMEFLEGLSLGQRLRQEPALQEIEVQQICRQVALALAETHGHRIVHRDLKPDNVMLVRDPEQIGGMRAKVLDFGIAKIRKTGIRMTRTHAILGTAEYMAPEQCRGSGQVDERADVYALGVMLFEMLAGEPPFLAGEEVEVMTMHLRTPPDPLRKRNPQVSPGIEALCARMLSKAPAERPTMSEAAEQLGQFLGTGTHRVLIFPQNAPPRSRTARLALAGGLGAVGVAGLFIGVLFLRHKDPPVSVRPIAPPTVSPAAAPPAAVPQLRHFSVTSEPDGAEVVDAESGQVLGRTPFVTALPDRERLNITLRRPHYENRSLTLLPQKPRHEKLVVELY